jgi:2-amino-4-hydroxy-6-hydroxymethyldihydropteridine diphosphokinase
MLAFSFDAKKSEVVPAVYLGIGSNRNPEENLQLGIRQLARRFELRAVSTVYRNAAIGFQGKDFLNAVVCVDTDKTPVDICAELEEVHSLAGRQRDTDPFVSRTLDIDLLLYDQLVIDEPPVRIPRKDVLTYSFVLRPLAEIAPDLIHPVTGRTMASHWSGFDKEEHPLTADRLIL